jgi:hypothetical protein
LFEAVDVIAIVIGSVDPDPVKEDAMQHGAAADELIDLRLVHYELTTGAIDDMEALEGWEVA